MQTADRDLPLFPLERVVLFPGAMLPLRIFEPRYRAMIRACLEGDRVFGVLRIRTGREVGPPADPEDVGCTARILNVDHLPDGRMNVLAVGEHRFRLLERPRTAPEGFLHALALVVTSESMEASAPPALAREVLSLLRVYLDTLARLEGKGAVPEESPDTLAEDPVTLSFRAAAALAIRGRERQRLLETDDVAERLREVRALLRRESHNLRLMATAPAPGRGIGPFSQN